MKLRGYGKPGRLAAVLVVAGLLLYWFFTYNPVRPNIIIIDLDTVRAQSLPFYGHPDNNMPFVSRLVEQGTIFDAAYTPFPHTVPAHATMFTGLYPWHNGVEEITPLPDSHITLAEQLKRAGYQTAAFVSGWTVSRAYGLSRGFDHFDDTIPGTGERRAGELTTAAFQDWLASNPVRQPLFLWIHYFDAHAPYGTNVTSEDSYSQYDSAPGNEPVPGKFVAPYLKKWFASFPSLEAAAAKYYPELRRIDRNVEKVLNALTARGLTENAVIIVLSDHGEGLGEHDYYFDHGERLYQEEIHIPLLLVGADRVPAGRRIGTEVSLIDIVPTVLALTGIQQGNMGLDGRSLLPLLNGKSWEPRALFAECGRYRPLMSYPTETRGASSRGRAVLQGGYKYLQYAGRPPELYRFSTDSREDHNLAGAGLAEEGQLRELWRRWAHEVVPDTAVPARGGDEARRLRALGYLQ